MEVDANAKSRFIDLEEVSKPHTEERDHRRIAVREDDGAITFRTFARVERDTCCEERSLVEGADGSDAEGVALLDLAELSIVGGVRATVRAGATLGRGEGHVANPEGDGRLRDVERVGDLLQRLVLGAQTARFFSFALLAAVAHGRMMRAGCDSFGRAVVARSS